MAEKIAEAGWEIVGHGFKQRSLQGEAKEAELIEMCLDRLGKFYGTRPRGWLGPGLKETLDTPDILKAAGVDYLCDWVIDDLPHWMTTKHGPMVCMPYTLEINDSPLYAIQQHSSDEIYRRFRDTLECLGDEVKTQPRILTIGLHPHLIGVPHRFGSFEQMLDLLMKTPGVCFMQGHDIADWYTAQVAAPQTP